MRQLLLLLVFVCVFLSFSKETAAAKPQSKILFQRADGTETELSEEELTKIVSQQQSKQSPPAENVKKVDKLDEIAEKDPVFALNIQLAHEAFRELQRFGYGRGYKLQGLSEKTITENKKTPTSTEKGEYKVTLYLHAKAIDLTKLSKHPDPEIWYEVNLSLDSERKLTIVEAWKMASSTTRGQNLSISSSKTATQLPDLKSNISFWLLAGGIFMIVIGVVIVYTSQQPQPKIVKRKKSDGDWELVDKKD